jgi:hypothetical protein
MKTYLCRRCEKPKPAAEVMSRHTPVNSTIERVRWHMCLDCRRDAEKRYRKEKVKA